MQLSNTLRLLALLATSSLPAMAAVSTTTEAAATPALLAGLPDFDLRQHELARVVTAADALLTVEPKTIVTAVNPRSAGGRHDFSSEGDYWWPDPKNPEGPYIRRDGETNPDNFVAHRQLLFSFARTIGALTAAYDLTRDERYAEAAARHLRAWFVDSETKMNPNLQYAQSIKGVTPGRGIGIIDTLHLAEVALCIEALQNTPALQPAERGAVIDWFKAYIHWLATSPNGREESAEKNNHGACWVLQVASFARVAGDHETLEKCRNRYKTDLLPNQMAADGGFPRELARTKPYGYSIFNLDVFAGLAAVLSTPGENLMSFTLPDGRGLVKGVAFLYPYLEDKSRWTRKPDVMYWNEWPIRQPALLFGALASGEKAWLDLWKRLPADSDVEEVQRNFPVRYPTLWLRHLRTEG